MKRATLMTIVAFALMGLIVLSGQAYSTDTAQTQTATHHCAKFADNNKDGVCDLTEQCKTNGHQCGKDCKACPTFKDDNKDGKCDLAGNCTQHSEKSAKSAGCAGAASGKCGHASTGCGGCGKHR
ncbi:MAG: hypothetical protein ACOZB3_00085 [Calditrichota bacterium]